MVGAAIGGVASLAGAAISSNSAGKAAKQQENSAQQAIDQSNSRYNQTVQNLQPYENVGSEASGELENLLGLGTAPGNQSLDQIKQSLISSGAYPYLDPNSTKDKTYTPAVNLEQTALDQAAQQQYSAQPNSVTSSEGGVANASSGANTGGYGSLVQPFTAADFTEDPGYQFALSQGQQALQRAQAAGGGLVSGAAVKALTDYNQGEADQQYQNAYDRYNTNQNNIYSRLTGQQSTGLSAVGTQSNAATGNATQVGDLLTSAGQAASNATTTQGNIASSSLGSLSNPTGAVQNYLSSSGTGLNVNQSAQSGSDNFYSALQNN